MLGFALNVTGSIGHFANETDLNVPGVATGFKPHGAHRGLFALMEVPVNMLGLQANSEKEALESKQPEARVNVNGEEKERNVGSTGLREEWATIRQDSGFEEVDLHDDTVAEKAQPTGETLTSGRPRVFNKKDSALSLPTGKVTVPPVVRKKNSELSLPLSWNSAAATKKSTDRWKQSVVANRHDPDSSSPSHSNSRLQELLINAIVLLQEAESRGSKLDVSNLTGK